jgi:hypothetical protein
VRLILLERAARLNNVTEDRYPSESSRNLGGFRDERAYYSSEPTNSSIFHSAIVACRYQTFLTIPAVERARRYDFEITRSEAAYPPVRPHGEPDLVVVHHPRIVDVPPESARCASQRRRLQ